MEKAVEGKFQKEGREDFAQKYKLTTKDARQLNKFIAEFAHNTPTLQDSSSLVIVLMSHGGNGRILGKLSQIRVCNLDYRSKFRMCF